MGARRWGIWGLAVAGLSLALVASHAEAQGDDPFAAEDDPFADDATEGADEAQPAESGEQSGEALPPPTVPDGYGGGQPQQGGAPPAQTAPNQQPGYGQTQPSYGQQQPYQPQQRPPRLRQVPYREGMTIPEGGRIVEKRRLGMIIAGGAMFLVAYGLSVSLYVDIDFSGMMLVPVVGPFIETREDDLFAIDRLLLVFDGLVQGVGLTLLGLGIGRKKKIVEFYGLNEPGWRVTPRLGPGGGGVDLRARF